MLENIVVNGNEQQRSWAFHTLNISSQFRGRRNVVGAVNFAVSPGEKGRTIFDAKSTEQLPGKKLYQIRLITYNMVVFLLIGNW